MQADMVREKELRVLHLDLQATGSEQYPRPSSQGHTSSNKVTPSHSATPYGPSIQAQVCGSHACSIHSTMLDIVAAILVCLIT